MLSLALRNLHPLPAQTSHGPRKEQRAASRRASSRNKKTPAHKRRASTDPADLQRVRRRRRVASPRSCGGEEVQRRFSSIVFHFGTKAAPSIPVAVVAGVRSRRPVSASNLLRCSKKSCFSLSASARGDRSELTSCLSLPEGYCTYDQLSCFPGCQRRAFLY